MSPDPATADVADVAVAGVQVGHWTHAEALTGCTVVTFPDGAVASGEVRGGAPATREFELLDPQRMVARIDAVVLSGGSAFGLATCNGVADSLAANGVGFETNAGPVPIVVGMSLFDLAEGDAGIRPGPAEGTAALTAAGPTFAVGRVGAGRGAMVDKWRSRDLAQPGGLGTAIVRNGELVVQAIMAVNAAGAIDDGSVTQAIADGTFEWPTGPSDFTADEPMTNTTIGLIVTNAALTKGECRVVAEGGHDGMARAIFPPHRRTDGDALVAVATGSAGLAEPGLVDVVRTMTVVAVEQAIRLA